MSRVDECGEDVLVARLTAGLSQGERVIVGPGDDCAVTDDGAGHLLTLHKTDCVIEGVHFLKDEVPERVGWKAAARVMSDFAAMGGLPEHLLVTVLLPMESEVHWVERLYVGLEKCVTQHGAYIVGGETSVSPSGLCIVVSGTGVVERDHLKLRSGARKGDAIYVTGVLGGSIRGKHLDFQPLVEMGVWFGAQVEVTAMMDLSDGLAKDLPRLAKMSQCGFVLDESVVPCAENCSVDDAMCDGEDYELLLTVREGREAMFEAAFAERFPHALLTNVGRIVGEKEGVQLSGGWEHFLKD